MAGRRKTSPSLPVSGDRLLTLIEAARRLNLGQIDTETESSPPAAGRSPSGLGLAAPTGDSGRAISTPSSAPPRSRQNKWPPRRRAPHRRPRSMTARAH